MKNFFKIISASFLFFFLFTGTVSALVGVPSSSSNNGSPLPSGSYGGELRLHFQSLSSLSDKIKYRASWEFNLTNALECNYDWLSYGSVYDPTDPPTVEHVTPIVAQSIRVIDCDENNVQLGSEQVFTYTINPALAVVSASPAPSNTPASDTQLVSLISSGSSSIRFNKISGSDVNAVPPAPACRTESNSTPTGEIYNDTTKIGLTIPFTAIKAVGCFSGTQDNGNGPVAYFWQTPVVLFKYNVGNDPTIPIINSDDDTITIGSSTNLKPVFPDGNGTIDNDVGAVVSGTSYTVTPEETTTYTLTITNTQGPKTATKTITVNPEVEPSISVSGNVTSNITNSSITVPYLVTGQVGDKWTVKVYKNSSLDEVNLKDTHSVSLSQESQSIPYTLSGVDDGNYIFISELLTYPSILYTTPDSYDPPVEHSFTQSVFHGFAINPNTTNGYSPDCKEKPGEYCLLEQLPGFPDRINSTFSLGSYLNRLFQLAIALAGVLGVVMLVVAGVTYMTTDSFMGKSDGKAMAMNAIGGVVLALLSWIILNTLNPNLLDFNLKVQDAVIKPGSFGENIAYNTDGSVAGCAVSAATPPAELKANPVCVGGVCVDIPSPIQIAPGVNKQVVEDLKNKLVNFQGVFSTWAVTEAWEPTREHCNRCHYEGTCIDAGLRNLEYSTTTIADFIQKAKAQNLRAQFETKDQALFDSIKASFKDNKDLNSDGTKKYSSGELEVLYLPGWVSGNHFSVYGN